jgi:hypothetical protein
VVGFGEAGDPLSGGSEQHPVPGLAGLSPYGFDTGMIGRWAYLSDSAQGCAAALQRLRLLLDAAGTAPQAVTLLPDRSSRTLGASTSTPTGRTGRCGIQLHILRTQRRPANCHRLLHHRQRRPGA